MLRDARQALLLQIVPLMYCGLPEFMCLLQFSNPFYYMPPIYVCVTLVKIVVNHAKSISPDNNGEREDRLIILRVVGGELSLVLSVYWSGVECTARQWSG